MANTGPLSNADQWIGDTPTEDKPHNVFRVVFNNINGLGSGQYRDNIKHLAATQSKWEVDYLGMTEHCINSNQPLIIKNIHTSLRQHHLGQYALQINSGQMTTTTAYLPGGTAILAMGPSISRIEPSGREGDNMGRWSSITYRRKQRSPLTIYTVYQVNPRPTNEIGITAWHQQRLQLNYEKRHETHPRTAFTEDIINAIKRKQNDNHDIIIGGDFNDTISQARSNVLKIAHATGLTDPWTRRFPNHDNFSTYVRGTNRIDSVLCSPNILQYTNYLGYSPYNWFTNSDHRAIAIDFNEIGLFGCQRDSLPALNLRGIRTNDRTNVAQLIHKWHSHLQANGIFEKINNETTTWTPELIEKIDKTIGQGGDAAEKICKKRRPTLYSKKIAKLRLIRTIVKKHIINLEGGVNQVTTLQSRLERYEDIDYRLSPDLGTSRQQYQEIRKEVSSIENTHREQREKEFDKQIENATAKGKRSKAKALQTIQRNEARRRTWQILQHAKHSQGNNNRLDRLDVPMSWPPPNTAIDIRALEDPKTCLTWKTITKPDEIEYYIQLRNQGHFGQAQGTPFTEPPLSEQIDWAATTATSESILSGTYTSNIPHCQAFLDTCRTASDLDIIPKRIEETEFAGKIKSWRETTSTSPSGRHLGRYKALYAKGPHKKHSEETEELHQKQRNIIQAIIMIINQCIELGHILERWKTIVNTMIFKDQNNYKIHRLRVIHIYEADFNLILAIKWRQLLHSAESRNLLHRGLFGGRPGCEAQSLTLLEELKYDISYTSRRAIFHFDNDATSCYDRIIVSLASLVNRRFGQHRQIVIIHANTLQQAKFHLRTQLGNSESSYTHCAKHPIYGSGQGSGNSPCIWLFISSSLCEAHDRLSYGATFVTPDQSINAKISIVGFVDDCTGTCNDFRPQNQDEVHQLTKKMQHDAQLWNDLLWCSGGKLELPKCSYHLLYFRFKPNGEPVPILDPPNVPIQVHDPETRSPIDIPPKKANDPHKTLGHWKSPADPNQHKQLAELLHKAKQCTTLITTSPLSRFGTMIAYHGQYIPIIKYVLPQCFFSKKALQTTESKTLQSIISRAGYNRNTATELRYAPTSYAGCGFIKWYTLQGEGQIQLFLKHWRTETIVSDILRVAVSWSQCQSGLSKSFLEDTTTKLPHLECRWLKSLRTFLRRIQANITLDNPFTTPPEREGDKFIMEYAINCGTFKTEDIKIINYCRLYLHVTTISEIFDAAGEMILPHMFKCNRPVWFDPDQYITIQTRPSAYQIRTKWQRLCREWCTDDGRIAASLNLGKWQKHAIPNRPKRETYLAEPTDNTLYHWIDGTYWILRPTSAKPSQYIPGEATDWKPTPQAVPVELTTIKQYPTPQYTLSTKYRITTSHPSTTLPATIINPWWQLLTENVQYATETPNLDHHTYTTHNADTLIIAFTGQSQDLKGQYGWTISDITGKLLAWKIEHIKERVTMHRTCQWGHLSAIASLVHDGHMNRTLNRRPSNLLIVSDQAQAITSISNRNQYETSYPNSCLAKDWDLSGTNPRDIILW